MLFGKSRICLLGLDGVPFSLLNRLIQDNYMPVMANLVRQGSLVSTESVLPPVSSVAWTSITTGKNPAGHGLFGFIDRTPDPLSLFLPSARNVKAERIWDILGKHGKSSIIINVPSTFPPAPLKGVLVGGFESPSLAKATYPPTLAAELEKLGYIIDVDAQKARQDKAYLLSELDSMLESRKKALFYLMEKHNWDLLLCHFMGTDRLHHFLWREWEANEPQWADGFFAYYRKLDAVIGEIVDRLPKKTVLMAASDHGFCAARKEVQLNRWLQDQGLLKLLRDDAEELAVISPETQVYSLIPGRFYINLQGREAKGTVPQSAYENVCRNLQERLETLRDPETGEEIITHVFTKAEYYRGAFKDAAPDVVVLACNGYELKSSMRAKELITPSVMSGMHTYDDAFWLTTGREIKPEAKSILDIAPTILQVLDIKDAPLDHPSALVK